MRKAKEEPSTVNMDKLPSITHFVAGPFKFVGCWEWFPKTENIFLIIINEVYMGFVLFFLMYMIFMFVLCIYIDWDDREALNLNIIADAIPFLACSAIVIYVGTHRQQIYELVDYIDENFKFHSARGLTNMTMLKSYKFVKFFQSCYVVSLCWSTSFYAFGPFLVHWMTGEPLQEWYYTEVTESWSLAINFLRQLFTNLVMGVTLGHTSIFFAMNAMYLCGQLELLCCSIRNVRFTAMLQDGVQHGALVREFGDALKDEEFTYMYNKPEMVDSVYNFDKKVSNQFQDRTQAFDIYNKSYDKGTEEALCKCVELHQMIAAYAKRIENFISPLLVVRVMQVTLYVSSLLYSLSRGFNMMVLQYLGATAFDCFISCYYGNQLSIQV